MSRVLESVSASKDGGGRDPDAGHGGGDLVKKVGLLQSLNFLGDDGVLGVQGEGLAGQVGRDDAGHVGACDGDRLAGGRLNDGLGSGGVAFGAVGLELGIDPRPPGLVQACELITARTLSCSSHGPSTALRVRVGRGLGVAGLGCGPRSS